MAVLSGVKGLLELAKAARHAHVAAHRTVAHVELVEGLAQLCNLPLLERALLRVGRLDGLVRVRVRVRVGVRVRARVRVRVRARVRARARARVRVT